MYAFYFVFDVLLYLLYCHITYCLHNIVSDHPVLLLLKIDWLIDWLMSLGCGLGAPSLVLVWGLPSLGLGSQNLDLGLGFETPVSCSWSWSWKSKYRSNSNSNNQIYISAIREPYYWSWSWSCDSLPLFLVLVLELADLVLYSRLLSHVGHLLALGSWKSDSWSCPWDVLSWSWYWFWDSRVLFLV